MVIIREMLMSKYIKGIALSDLLSDLVLSLWNSWNQNLNSPGREQIIKFHLKKSLFLTYPYDITLPKVILPV